MVVLMEIVCLFNIRPFCVASSVGEGVEKIFEKIKKFFVIYFLILSLHVF